MGLSRGQRADGRLQQPLAARSRGGTGQRPRSSACEQENCPRCQKPPWPAENKVPPVSAHQWEHIGTPSPMYFRTPRCPWSTGWPQSCCGSSPGEITAPFLQRLNLRSRNPIIRACQFGTQHCNRSSYQQLDTPPRLICARNTMTVLNRELDYLFKLFTKGWGDFSVI